MFVYLITNLINGKRYVGQTSFSIETRWSQHQTRSSCKALRAAIDKYGAENFNIEPLCAPSTKELAGEIEIEYIGRYNTRAPNGYNLTLGGEGVKGLPDEIRLKRNKALRGNKNSVGAVRTPEYLEAISKRFKGRVFSENTKRKMSEAASKRKDSSETRKKKSDNAKRLGLRPPKLSKEELARAGQISGHNRYHLKRGITNPKCLLCKGQSNDRSTTGGERTP